MKLFIYGFILIALILSGINLQASPGLQEMGRWNTDFYCGNVLVQNQKAYLYDSDTMVILDVSNPASPQKLGEITFPMDISDIYISGNYAYVTTYFGAFSGGTHDNDGLRIIDISNSTSPHEISFIFSYCAKCISVSGNYAYVGSAFLDTQFYSGGFSVFDVSVPTSPQQVAKYNGSGMEDIITDGNLAYMVYFYSSRVSATGGLVTFNISKPDQPIEIDRYETYEYTLYVTEKNAHPRKIVRSNNLLFLTTTPAGSEFNTRFYSMDISTPGSMKELSLYETPDNMYGHAISGIYLYYATGDNLKVLDVSSPDSPVPTNYTYTGSGPLGVYTSGDTVYVAEGNNGLAILSSATINSPPFGTFETPSDGNNVSGSIPVSGWVLDDKGIDTVKVYRAPTTGEGNALVYLGDAVLVEGARPDVEQSFPAYPMNSKAGWGYMMLTNYNMPNQGNGPVTIVVVATDSNGATTTLGSKTITLDNINATKPFGALDTPAQGGIASGSKYLNWGWALTPQPNTIPTNGSTIDVFVDGVKKGHPVYNLYRQDVAEYFPNYNNSNGAVGYFYLDTTKYADGIHTISWNVKDNAGNADGIGSRYFAIRNSNNRSGKTGATDVSQKDMSLGQVGISYRKDLPLNNAISGKYALYTEPVGITKGFNTELSPQKQYPDSGKLLIELNALERIEIRMDNSMTTGTIASQKGSSHYWSGYWKAPGGLRPLPTGSFLDNRGIFYWQPGPGMKGSFNLMFIKTNGDEDYNQQILNMTILLK